MVQWLCARDVSFGEFGLLLSGMPTPLSKPSGAPDLYPTFVGGSAKAITSVDQHPLLLVESWDPSFPGGVNWRALRLVFFPADGRPEGLGRSDGTQHVFLSDLSVDCEYLDWDVFTANAFLIFVREAPGNPPWRYIFRQVTVTNSSLGWVQTNDIALETAWLFEPSDYPPIGNAKVSVDVLNPSRVALVSTQGASLRVTVLNIGQTVTAGTSDFSSVLPAGMPNVFYRLRLESVDLGPNYLYIAMTGFRGSGESQGLIFRLTVAGTTASRDPTYGSDGLWLSSLANYLDFRAAHLFSSNVLIGASGSKLVAFGVSSDGSSLDPAFGVSGICEFDLGGTLLDPIISADDRNGWIHAFAQREQDLSTVGARVRIASPIVPVPNGTIDPSFGTNGVVTLRVDGYATAPAGIGLDQYPRSIDVALTRSWGGADPNSVPGMARLNFGDGTLVPQFGSGGAARHPWFSVAAFAQAGACVAAGTRFEDNTLVVVWADSQGGFQNWATLPYSATGDQVDSLRLHPDGSIWVAGEGPSAWIGKVTSAGALDATFGTGGFAKLRSADGYGIAVLIGFQQSGQAVVYVGSQVGSFISVVSAAGQVDSTFGQNGFVQLPAFDIHTGFTVVSNDAVVFAAHTIHDPTGGGPPVTLGLIRVTAAGAIDAAFGVGSQEVLTAPSARIVRVATTNPSSPEIAEAKIITIIEKSGKLYAIGTATATASLSGPIIFPTFDSLLITRWNQDGTLDTTFAGGGVAMYGGTTSPGWTCTSATMDAYGVITLAGSVDGRPAIWQLLPSDELDPTFGAGGFCSVQIQEVTEDNALAVTGLPGGKVRIACHSGLVQFALKQIFWWIPWWIVLQLNRLLAALRRVFSARFR